VSINYLHNDPAAAPRRIEAKAPRAEPRSEHARFEFPQTYPERRYDFGEPGFLFWQCREAALATLEAWALIDRPLRAWQSGSRRLLLRADHGPGLNAHYDRAAVSFFSWPSGTPMHTGASGDAVAHEVGHAILDAIRPDLWDAVFTEIAAFHEAFADCLALLVGFFDLESNKLLLDEVATLKRANFLEAIAESVAVAIRAEHGAGHPQSQPRRAANHFAWQFPVTLPPRAAPAALSSEPHSFSQVFTGSFYDVVANIFAMQDRQDALTLRDCALTAGRLLAKAAHSAPETMRFFQAVGRTMILEDAEQNDGRHHLAIKEAFAEHGIALGSSAMLAPTVPLSGSAPRLNARSRVAPLTGAVLRDVRARMTVRARARIGVGTVKIGGQRVAKVVHRRRVPLDHLGDELRGVTGQALEAVLVGASAKRAAILGELPNPQLTEQEVSSFVEGLLASEQVRRAASRGATAPAAGAEGPATHAVRKRGKRKLLKRIRFSCGVRGVDGA